MMMYARARMEIVIIEIEDDLFPKTCLSWRALVEQSEKRAITYADFLIILHICYFQWWIVAH
jgi:hypothetical protein